MTNELYACHEHWQFQNPNRICKISILPIAVGPILTNVCDKLVGVTWTLNHISVIPFSIVPFVLNAKIIIIFNWTKNIRLISWFGFLLRFVDLFSWRKIWITCQNNKQINWRTNDIGSIPVLNKRNYSLPRITNPLHNKWLIVTAIKWNIFLAISFISHFWLWWIACPYSKADIFLYFYLFQMKEISQLTWAIDQLTNNMYLMVLKSVVCFKNLKETKVLSCADTKIKLYFKPLLYRVAICRSYCFWMLST